VGGPGRLPFWRTLKESCEGLGSVTFKINAQHTVCARERVPKTIKLPLFTGPGQCVCVCVCVCVRVCRAD